MPLCMCENAYFIQQREPGYENASIAAILLESCSYTTVAPRVPGSDSLVNIGGWLAVNDLDLFNRAPQFWWQVYEGSHD